ncbi:S1/P1 nuclease [Sphingobacteriaceae bacterium WQ 2009]|uniref:S1/P1 nuclease n=1 Tax=Rhinopithecimicrobium faecis TaxID=2820698 RepID=A0A8T4HC88_9SPHI|nr:S1/P1 nuclease [Sphingobacteriaceae bacterium WQ 2009]
MKNILKSLLVVGLCLKISAASAWGTTGHRVVAEIAERNLSSKAKKNIEKLIGKQKLAYWANWPDFVKSDHAWDHTGNFHFINTEGMLSVDAFKEAMLTSKEDNIYKAILRLESELKDKNLPLKQKQENLYFIIHLVGDAHQPMHVSRAEDLGGNKVEVTWFGKKTNIHRVWDTDIVEGEKYSYTEYATVLDIFNKQQTRAYQAGELADWLYESSTMADKIYADVAHNANLSYRYVYENKSVAEDALLKGGLRLAKILNGVFAK